MSALGLHLKTNGFSAVEVEKKKSKNSLLNWGSHEMPNFTLDIENEENRTHYSRELKKFLFDFNFESTDAIVSLPQDQVFVRTIKVPHMSKKDLDNFIKYESEQYIPLPLEEVTLGYAVMNLDLEDQDKTSVLLVAAKKTVSQKYIQIVKEAGLTPRALEPESLSMTRALGGDMHATGAELVIEIGPKETLIVLAYKGFVILTRTIPLGDLTLTKSLAQKMDLDMTRAKEYKNSYGLDKSKVEGKVYEALHPLFDRLISEIKKSKVFFTTHNPNVRINKIVVSGETALMPGLLLYMVNNFDVEVELANPWTNLNLDSVDTSKDDFHRKGPIYAVPVGLAMKVS
ncbi:type IV pilus assembly protein PilM [candidate division WWE3 bacterium]|nr:type IV pilus assembly protein PilM [candidate division WWE3 bacterium]